MGPGDLQVPSRIVGSSIGAALLLYAVTAGSQSLGREALTFKEGPILSGRPLADVADILQCRYGRPVTYEDPIWAWNGDGEPSLVRPTVIVPIRRSMTFPSGLTPDETPVLDIGALGRALGEYRKQNELPSFRIWSSSFGLHIAPEAFRDAKGLPAASKSALDATVSIPTAVRSVSDSLGSICASASPAAGVKIVCSAVAINEDWYKKLFAAPGGTLEWGAAGMSARDALIDLFDRSATTFSWRLYCGPSDQTCVLNVTPVQVAKTDSQGKLKAQRLEYDRCRQCAPGDR
jgi:hypothetical protein